MSSAGSQVISKPGKGATVTIGVGAAVDGGVITALEQEVTNTKIGQTPTAGRLMGR